MALHGDLVVLVAFRIEVHVPLIHAGKGGNKGTLPLLMQDHVNALVVDIDGVLDGIDAVADALLDALQPVAMGGHIGVAEGRRIADGAQLLRRCHQFARLTAQVGHRACGHVLDKVSTVADVPPYGVHQVLGIVDLVVNVGKGAVALGGRRQDKAAADNVRSGDHAIANGIPHGDIRVAGASAVADRGVAVLQVVLGKADAVHHGGIAVLHQQAVEIRIDQHQMGVQIEQPRQHRFSGGVQRLALCGNSAARANSGDISILDKDIRHRSTVALGKLRDEATILQKHDTTSSYILIISGQR